MSTFPPAVVQGVDTPAERARRDGLLGVAAWAIGSLCKTHPGHVFSKAAVAGSKPQDRSLALAIKLVDCVMSWIVIMAVSPGFHMVLFEDALDFLVGCWYVWLLQSAALFCQFVCPVVSQQTYVGGYPL